MTERGIIGNPLGWVQAQLVGGWRKALIMGTIYLGVTFGLLVLFYRITVANDFNAANAARAFCRGALIVLTVIQAALLLLLSGGAVLKAVQRDMTSGQIDVHRLTPMSGWTAVLGYLTGPNLLLVPFTAANCLLATGLSLFGGEPLSIWIFGALLFACVGFAGASLNLLLAMSTRKANNVVGLLVFLGVFAGPFVVFIIPGIGLLTGLFSGVSMAKSMTGSFTFDPRVILSLGGQMVLAAIALTGASRKYRRNDVPALAWWQGLLLVAFVCIYEAVGMRVWPEYSDTFMLSTFRWANVDTGSQFIAGMCLVMLTMLSPVGSAAIIEARWLRHRRISPTTVDARPINVWVVAAMALGLMAVLTVAGLGPRAEAILPPGVAGYSPAVAMALAIGVFILAFIPFIVLMRWVYGFREKAAGVIATWVALMWIAPVAIDLTYRAYFVPESEANPPPTWLHGCSPAGFWTLLWKGGPTALWPGFCVIVLMVVVVVFFTRWGKKPPATPVS